MGATKKVAWAKQNGVLVKDSAKGVNKKTKGHHGATEQQQWRPKTTNSDLPTATSEAQKKKDKDQTQRLEQQK